MLVEAKSRATASRSSESVSDLCICVILRSYYLFSRVIYFSNFADCGAIQNLQNGSGVVIGHKVDVTQKSFQDI